MARIIGAASENHRAMMARLARLTNAQEVRYRNLGNGEDYIVVKDGIETTIKVRGNRVDGGFLGGIDP